MPRLYAIRGLCFATLLEKDNFSRIYIKNNTWKYYHVLTKVIFKSVIYRSGEDYVKINMQGLDQDLGNSRIKGVSRRFSGQVIEDLVKWKVLRKKFVRAKVDASYHTTVYLKLTDEVRNRGWERAPMVSPLDIVRARRGGQAPLLGVYHHIQQHLPAITLDVSNARAFTDWALQTRLPLRNKQRGYFRQTNRTVGRAQHAHWHTALDEIEAGSYRVVVDHAITGRHFTPFTNLPRELRGFLRINGKPLVELDIRNSQPLIFARKLLAVFRDELPADVAHYIELVQKGTFYAAISQLIEAAGEQVDPDVLKSSFFAKVFFSAETVNYRWRQLFAERFPHISSAITAMKLHDYRHLSRQLMRMESDLIVRTIAARLYRENVTEFFTLHDAFYCPADQVDVLYSTIVEEYKAVGLQVPIRATALIEPTAHRSMPAPPEPGDGLEPDGVSPAEAAFRP